MDFVVFISNFNVILQDGCGRWPSVLSLLSANLILLVLGHESRHDVFALSAGQKMCWTIASGSGSGGDVVDDIVNGLGWNLEGQKIG